MNVQNIWLADDRYNETLSEVFGYTEITNCVYVGDQPDDYVSRLLVALDLVDPFEYTIEY